jgi:hypothetical protein
MSSISLRVTQIAKMIGFGRKKSTGERGFSPNQQTLVYSVLMFRMPGLKWIGIMHRTWKLLLFWRSLSRPG